eukprot:7363502-Pyramimonas_sp.AAC.1
MPRLCPIALWIESSFASKLELPGHIVTAPGLIDRGDMPGGRTVERPKGRTAGRAKGTRYGTCQWTTWVKVGTC